MKDGGRARRIAAQIQRSLAELLPRAVKDPRVGSITITAVTLAPDMGEARVYFLPFGGRHSPDECLRGLHSASSLLRGLIGRQLGLRHAPRLQFMLDTQLERAHELTALIDRAVHKDQERAAHTAPAATAAPATERKP